MSFSEEEKQLLKTAAKNFEKAKKAWEPDKLAVFEQLMQLPAYLEWVKDNIIINREISHVNKEIMITVIYKGEYEKNKTSLQRLQEIKELVCRSGAAAGTASNLDYWNETTVQELISKILEIIDFDETRCVPLEEIITEEDPDEETN